MKMKLKSTEMRLAVNGVGVVTNANASELYDVVIKINPSLAEYFEPDEAKEPSKKKDRDGNV